MGEEPYIHKAADGSSFLVLSSPNEEEAFVPMGFLRGEVSSLYDAEAPESFKVSPGPYSATFTVEETSPEVLKMFYGEDIIEQVYSRPAPPRITPGVALLNWFMSL